MFERFATKLDHWTKAGLISDDQRSAIITYEQTRHSGNLGRSLTNVGIFAILLGLLSVIGANWAIIPAFGKLGLHAALNLIVAAMIFRFDPAAMPHKRDFFVTALFGLFLTFIALIAQIFELHGEIYQTLLFWLALCTPFVWYLGRSHLAIMPWIAALITTLIITLFEMAPFEHLMEALFPLIAFYIPILFLSLASWPVLKRYKPGFVTSLHDVGVAIPMLLANAGILLLYMPVHTFHYQSLVLAGLILGLTIILITFNPRFRKEAFAFDQWLYLLISGALFTLPFVLLSYDGQFIPAVLFILYWLYMAWLGARINNQHLTDWALRLVILRLIIVYLEVFGNLMTTGLGMILSGVLLVLIIKYAKQLMGFGRKLAKHEI